MRKREAARGGKHLDTLAYMMRVGNTQTFGTQVQAHYTWRFAGDTREADRWLARLYRLVGVPPDMRTALAGARLFDLDRRLTLSIQPKRYGAPIRFRKPIIDRIWPT